MDYSQYLQGSPLVPRSLLAIFIASIFLLSLVLYSILHKKKRPARLKQKVKLLTKTFLVVCLTSAAAFLIFAAYLFLPSPRVQAPGNSRNTVSASTDQKIEIIFDRPVSRRILEESIEPEVPGVWLYEGSIYDTHLYRRLVFYPDSPLNPSTKYKVTLKNITNTSQIPAPYTYEFSFQTPTKDSQITLAAAPTKTKLNVPIYLQQHPLSCEVSALRMTLAFRGIKVSEETLLNQVGFDPTPHKGNTWGNPHQAFVGNVNGKQMTTGYGVYWTPIARVGQMYRSSSAFENWTVAQLTNEIKNGNPVIIWTYSRNGTPTSWTTPDGTKIYAVAGEHTVVAVGFVGDPSNPTQVIVNDPLVGQVYWSRSTFNKKWASFSNSGVVIR